MSKLYVMGIGPGSEDYLTLKVKKIADSADVLVGSRRALELFPSIKGEKVELNSKKMEISLKQAVQEAENGKIVALLSTGDPGFSGILKPILKLSGALDVEVVPGVSSVQLCAAKLQLSWDEVNLITLHGKGVSQKLLRMLDNGKPTMILPNFDVKEVVGYLLENGVKSIRKVAICEKLSYPDERILNLTLEEVLNHTFSYMCVMVIF